MKHLSLALLMALLCGLVPVCAQIPANGFHISSATTIRSQTALAPLADYLSEYINAERTFTSIPNNGEIVLSTDDALATEGFRLDISPQRISICGGSYGGVFNGIQALFRLLPPEIYAKNCTLPVTVADTLLSDAPKYAYRGMMLDVCRTWMDAEAVKRYLDLLAYHNINKLHLHLTDDEGWRIEIKSHPELTEIGGFRGGDSPIKAVYGKWDQKYGGYYTQAQMREMIDYAAVRNIEIIPEIDLPGHSRNIGSVLPEIRCNFPPDTASTHGYDFRSAWCVAREANYTLLKEILDELCALFPSKYIHVGGDEVEMTQWESCPDCRELIKRKGMTDTHQLQELFMVRMSEILAANGKLPGVWNEAIETGKLSHETLVYGWENVKACLDATTKGYPTVVMPGQYFYFDMRQTPTEDGHDWAAIFDAKKVFGFDPSAQGFTPEQQRNIVGFEGTFFSEAYISHEPEKPDYLDYMCFPRICALGRIAWSGNAQGWDTYYKELVSEHYDRMASMGIRFRLFPPTVSYKEGTFTATTDDNSEIYYLIGDAPEEHRYTKPIKALKPHLYRFFTRYKTAHSPFVADKSYYQTLTPIVTLTTSMGESKQLPYANAATYKGMTRTQRTCGLQDWIVYTFAQPVKCREMVLQTGNRQLPRAIFTTGYAEISYDGLSYERAGELVKGSITLYPERPIKSVRLVSTCTDNGLPYVSIQPPRIKPVL